MKIITRTNKPVTEKCTILSDLYIHIGCRNFEKCPFSLNLMGHTPNFSEIAKCINTKKYLEQVLINRIERLCIEKQSIFVNINDIYINTVKIQASNN